MFHNLWGQLVPIPRNFGSSVTCESWWIWSVLSCVAGDYKLCLTQVLFMCTWAEFISTIFSTIPVTFIVPYRLAARLARRFDQPWLWFFFHSVIVVITIYNATNCNSATQCNCGLATAAEDVAAAAGLSSDLRWVENCADCSWIHFFLQMCYLWYGIPIP